MRTSKTSRTPATAGCTCFRLRRLTRRVTAVYDRALAAAGMRVTQFSLLAQLRRVPGMPMSALASALDMDRTTLTRSLQPLLGAGWVRLAHDAADARIRAVHITTAGEAQWRAALECWREAQAEVMATLGEAELGRLHALLDACIPLFRPDESPAVPAGSTLDAHQPITPRGRRRHARTS